MREWGGEGRRVAGRRGGALTADVRVGRQAVAEQLHVPPGGIHAAAGRSLASLQVSAVRPDPRRRLIPTALLGQLLSTRESAAPDSLADLGPVGGPPLRPDTPNLGPGSGPREAPPP